MVYHRVHAKAPDAACVLPSVGVETHQQFAVFSLLAGYSFQPFFEGSHINGCKPYSPIPYEPLESKQYLLKSFRGTV